MKKVIYFDIKEALPYLTNYLEDYERYNYDNKIIKLDIDLEGNYRRVFKTRPNRFRRYILIIRRGKQENFRRNSKGNRL